MSDANYIKELVGKQLQKSQPMLICRTRCCNLVCPTWLCPTFCSLALCGFEMQNCRLCKQKLKIRNVFNLTSQPHNAQTAVRPCALVHRQFTSHNNTVACPQYEIIQPVCQVVFLNYYLVACDIIYCPHRLAVVVIKCQRTKFCFCIVKM